MNGRIGSLFLLDPISYSLDYGIWSQLVEAQIGLVPDPNSAWQTKCLLLHNFQRFLCGNFLNATRGASVQALFSPSVRNARVIAGHPSQIRRVVNSFMRSENPRFFDCLFRLSVLRFLSQDPRVQSEDIVNKKGIKRALALLDISESMSLMRMTTGLAICVERPRQINLGNRLQAHADNGPALIWADNTQAFAIHGVGVLPHVVQNPASITFEELLEESNLEVARVLLERMPPENFLRDAKEIKRDSFGILYDVPLEMRRAAVLTRLHMRVVELTNASAEPDGSFKKYLLKVPPGVRTPKEAVAWSFGLMAKEYSPLVES